MASYLSDMPADLGAAISLLTQSSIGH